MHIEYLADHPHFVPTITQWHHDTWRHLNPDRTYEQRKAHVERALNRAAIPTIFIAVQDKQPVGCASLIKSDMPSRPELTPWLASVYVEPDMRRQGIGSALVRRVESEAHTLHIPTLYLLTPDHEKFYAGLGWQHLERCQYRGETVTIMARNLTQRQSEGTATDE